MPLDLKVSIDTSALSQALAQLTKDELPGALAHGMNRVAGVAKRAVQTRMEEVFDNPKPWTKNAFFVRAATPQDQTAWVATRDFAPGGTAAYDYLRPEIFGGPRPMKKSEKALRPIVGDQYWVPGRGAPLDAYGNIQRGEIVRILSRLGLMQDPLQNMTDRTAKRLARKGQNARGQRSEYFIAREKGNGRAKGIYKLIGPGNVVPILVFVRQPSYRAVLPVEQIVQDAADQNAEAMIGKAVRYAIRKRLE